MEVEVLKIQIIRLFDPSPRALEINTSCTVVLTYQMLRNSLGGVG